MGPIAHALCAKPVIGPLMFIAFQCAFPPLFQDVSLDVALAGSTAAARFTVPVDLRYPLLATFAFPDAAALRADTVVGERYDASCDGRPYRDVPAHARPGLGQPIPLRVVIRNARDGTPVLDRTVDTLCLVSSGGRWTKTRGVMAIPLARGEYTAEITNLAAQPALTGVRVTLMLAGGTGK